jgi:hypothetical protein
MKGHDRRGWTIQKDFFFFIVTITSFCTVFDSNAPGVKNKTTRPAPASASAASNGFAGSSWNASSTCVAARLRAPPLATLDRWVIIFDFDVEFMRWNTEGRLVAVDSTRDSSRSVLVASRSGSDGTSSYGN